MIHHQALLIVARHKCDLALASVLQTDAAVHHHLAVIAAGGRTHWKERQPKDAQQIVVDVRVHVPVADALIVQLSIRAGAVRRADDRADDGGRCERIDDDANENVFIWWRRYERHE